MTWRHWLLAGLVSLLLWAIIASFAALAWMRWGHLLNTTTERSVAIQRIDGRFVHVFEGVDEVIHYESQ